MKNYYIFLRLLFVLSPIHSHGLTLDEAMRGFNDYQYIEKAAKNGGKTSKFVLLKPLPSTVDCDANQIITGIAFGLDKDNNVLAIKPVKARNTIPDQSELFAIVERSNRLQELFDQKRFENLESLQRFALIRKWAIACLILNKEAGCFSGIERENLASINEIFIPFGVEIKSDMDENSNRILLRRIARLNPVQK